MHVSERIRQIEDTVRRYAFVQWTIKVDETRYSIKYRLHIEADLFVQVYFNERSGTIGLALIHRGQRLYGRDCEAGRWHRHPDDEPTVHDASPDGARVVSLEEFLAEVQDVLIRNDLI